MNTSAATSALHARLVEDLDNLLDRHADSFEVLDFPPTSAKGRKQHKQLVKAAQHLYKAMDALSGK